MPLHPDLADAIAAAIAHADGGRFVVRAARPVGGGCISRNLCIADGGRRYFVKIDRNAGERFAAEADGLAALARCAALVVPRVVAQGAAADEAFLVLDWLDLDTGGDDARLGDALAALHDIACPRFGWGRNNFIGATPQANGWHDDWASFFAERRLRPQLALAARNGAPQLAAQATPLLAALPELLDGHRPRAVLLHGDLWHGNTGFTRGRPALFDPAVHAGDGEADLAMAALFGGFSPRFFAAYHARHPLLPGHQIRCRIYQLYHVLNHYNLFGGGYARQAATLIAALAGRNA
ncbi:MAG: fructosamine kinase family protein [Rhodocyclales bacterium]|nr:fructosamine kinase family protein [Rhodocyclales bacterium]